MFFSFSNKEVKLMVKNVCVHSYVTAAQPMVRELVPHVSFSSVFASRSLKITERGLGINRASKDQRIAELQFSLVF